MTEDEVRAMIRDKCMAMGSQKAVAEAFGVSQQFLGDVLLRNRALGKKMLAGLGLRRVVTYELVGLP